MMPFALIGFVCSGILFLYWFQKDPNEGDEFRIHYLVWGGKRSLKERSRKQILIEALFMLALAIFTAMYEMYYPK